MTNVVNLDAYRAPVQLPRELLDAKTWLCWRLVHMPGDPKPKKLPHYATTGYPRGRPKGGDDYKVGQGHPDDLGNLVSFDRAVAAVIRGRFSGVGLAMVSSNNLVALDFDNCITNGEIHPEVREVIAGTYSEISPSGNGVRAFFTGAIRDAKESDAVRKSRQWPYDVEFFHGQGYVTVTGNQTPDCQFFGYGETIAPLSDRALALYRQRFESPRASVGSAYGGSFGGSAAESSGFDLFAENSAAPGFAASKPSASGFMDDSFFDDMPGAGSQHAGSHVAGVAGGAPWQGADGASWLGSVNPKIGLTIEKAKAYLDALDEDCGYRDWLNAGQCLHHEFDGSESALEVWREWSRKSAEKYPGDKALDAKWASFGRYLGQPITAAWLLKHSKVARVAARYDALAEWKQKIKDADSDYDLREKVVPGIVTDQRVGDVERETLVHELIARFKAFGTKLTLPVVRKMILPPSLTEPTVKTAKPLTEFGMAERMLDKYGSDLMYVPESATWYTWTGVYWREANDVEIEHLAKEAIRALPDEAAEHSDSAEFYGFCAIAQQKRMVSNMVSLAASDPRVVVRARELDSQSYLLGARNGVVDLRTGALMPPAQSQRITRVCSCDYKPDATAATWRQTVLEIFSGDEDMAAFFQRLIGYCTLGDPTEDVMVIAHGNGSNGKSTLFGTIRQVLGGYSKSADAGTFLSDTKGGAGSGGPREDLMRLQGSRFVYVNEPDENGELREGMVKSMTGGDAITARGVYGKKSVEFEPSWVVCMPTNHKPIIKGSDYGIWRRLLMLPFLRNFDSDPNVVKDDKRAAKLKAEAEGVLAWIVEGAAAYLGQGLKPPPIVRAAREQYRSQMDLLADWMEECCDIGPEFSATIKELWSSWESHARERGSLQYVRSSIALGRRLDQRFPQGKGTGGKRLRLGIRLKRGDESYRDDFFGPSS